jgi:hypothetical protein
MVLFSCSLGITRVILIHENVYQIVKIVQHIRSKFTYVLAASCRDSMTMCVLLWLFRTQEKHYFIWWLEL